MTERVKQMWELFRAREYRKMRSTQVVDFGDEIAATDAYGLFTAYMGKSLEKV